MRKILILFLLIFISVTSPAQNNDWVSLYEDEDLQYINKNIENEVLGYRFWIKTILHGETKPTKDDPKTHELSHRLDYWFITSDYTKACNLAFYVYDKNGEIIMDGQLYEENRTDAAKYIVPDTEMWFFKELVKEIMKNKKN